MEFQDILKTALSKGASDVHLKVGVPPILRIDGLLRAMKELPRFSPEMTKEVAYALMSERQKARFQENNEVDISYTIPELGRFRVNIFMQRGSVSLALRAIPYTIPTIEKLLLPKVIEKLAMERRGLILVTGTTGSGKSTTLAAMVNHINNYRNAHVITIEDPIEFLHRDKKSIINQREVGQDTNAFNNALRVALRQDPDVILVGEMRDLETIETAIMAAETGHLVMSTLHTLDATETVNRIIAVFPPFQQEQIRLELAAVLKGVISQRLMPKADGVGRVPAVEVLVATARVREYIIDKNRTKEIGDAIAEGHVQYGMQTFDQSLMALLSQNLITYEEALNQATNPDDFALKVGGVSATSDTTWDDFTAGGMAEQGKEAMKIDQGETGFEWE
ncbi:MAG TPA: type IV pilus twitching motility protein PilT [Thermodesulfobacteriota bacterium]|nr:type IV pilus twitching motility protein PilT [Thermodesulfobacteriota bacterium]